MKNTLKSWLTITVAAALAGCAALPGAPIDINLVALNDFHGHLEAGRFTFTSVTDKQARTIQAGGIDTIGAALQAWRALPWLP